MCGKTFNKLGLVKTIFAKKLLKVVENCLRVLGLKDTSCLIIALFNCFWFISMLPF
jgi:hypothetical protein